MNSFGLPTIIRFCRRACFAGIGLGITFFGAGTMAHSRKFTLSFSSKYELSPPDPNEDRNKPLFFRLGAPPGVAELQELNFTADIGTDFQIWLDKKVPTSNTGDDARSLAVKITSSVDRNDKDKIFFNPIAFFSRQHVDIVETKPPYFFSFDMMLDPSYETPSQWAMHMQVWQCCGGAPPLTLNVMPSNDKHSPIELSLGLRDDVTQRLPGHPEKIIWNSCIERGQWYKFDFQLAPASIFEPESGLVVLWLNDRKVATYRGPWGYDPHQGSFEGHPVGHALGIEVGTYRRRQATTQIVYFDNIRYGRSSSDIGMN